MIMANCLAENKQYEDALEIMADSIEIRRRLAESYPGSFLTDLANSLNSLSNHLMAVGRKEQGLEAIRECVGIRRHLVDARSDAYKSSLARSLTRESVCLADLENFEEALSVVAEACDIYRSIIGVVADTHSNDFVDALFRQAQYYANISALDNALESIEEAEVISHQMTPEFSADKLQLWARLCILKGILISNLDGASEAAYCLSEGLVIADSLKLTSMAETAASLLRHAYEVDPPGVRESWTIATGNDDLVDWLDRLAPRLT
jgi:tetratricopeptide (TPR) repeat protein